MDAFNPGDGWRLLSGDESIDDREYIEYGPKGLTSDVQWWVREKPVPPLPTDPYTAIRVTWRDSDPVSPSVFWLVATSRNWCDMNGQWHDINDLQDAISGFEVLARPVSISEKN